ncbi:hypothetical protein [Tomitella gaofuii]|uniref:hypothetical protein n=1 Tax=Tomitella gaofuii TaxID=2760083 RepID=UPI0015FAD160|nr:hypothetical protein [Tomitella gaofuii]
MATVSIACPFDGCNGVASLTTRGECVADGWALADCGAHNPDAVASFVLDWQEGVRLLGVNPYDLCDTCGFEHAWCAESVAKFPGLIEFRDYPE